MKDLTNYINEMADRRLAGEKVVIWGDNKGFYCTPESNYEDGAKDDSLVMSFPKSNGFKSADQVKNYLIKFFAKTDKNIVLK